MAAVRAELMYRDGQREKLSVKVENNLNSLINGIQELNVNVSRILSELVEREKEEEDDSDEDDEPEEPPKS
uniref:Si:dkeyp-55f12.3 n=1 Tax=Labrus bergylta TaxID=56723 RepID=A0A3Q3NCJ3_9LABR